VSINPELIEAIASELVVDASLVEKDWYAIRIIAAIAKGQTPCNVPGFLWWNEFS
jgi:hypothetical protein